MFGNIFKSVKEFFSGPPLRETFEDMLVQQAVEDQKKNELVLDKCPYTGAKAEPVNPQITDAVTQVAPVPVAEEVAPAPVVEEVAPAKPKRARTAKGKLKADDKSTPDVNEAWDGGKAPAKKPRKSKKK